MFRYIGSSLAVKANLYRETNENLPGFWFNPAPLNA
jgi:hypothetical protein